MRNSKHGTARARTPWFLMLLTVAIWGCGGGSSDDGDGGAATDGSSVGSAALSTDELVNACLRASACEIMTYPSLYNCVESYNNLYLPQGLGPIYNKLYRCVNLAAGDCAAIGKCFKWGAACDKDYKASCKGTVAASCDLIGGRVYELDCADAKLKCMLKSDTSSSATAYCSPGSCQTGFQDKCEGKRELSCSGNVLEMRDCQVLGMNCGYGGWKKTYKNGCQGETGDKCFVFGKDVFKDKCEGSVAISCHLSRQHREDCTKHKMLYTACKDGQCVAAGSQCDRALNRCSGQQLEACLDGTWQKFDCAKLGFGPCKKASTYGANCSKNTAP